MKSTFGKILLIVIIAVMTVFICFFGLKSKAEKMENQKVKYAQLAVEKDIKAVDNIISDLNKFYFDSSHDTLVSDVNADKLKEIADRLGSIKVSVDDFKVKAADLPKEAKELTDKKEKASTILKDIQQKIDNQTAINNLLTNPITNWQEASDDLVIKSDTDKTKLDSLKTKLAGTKGKWQEVAAGYLAKIEDQVNLSDTIEGIISKSLSDDEITSYVNVETYDLLAEKIKEVKNKELQDKYSEKAQEILRQLNEKNAQIERERLADSEEDESDTAASGANNSLGGNSAYNPNAGNQRPPASTPPSNGNNIVVTPPASSGTDGSSGGVVVDPIPTPPSDNNGSSTPVNGGDNGANTNQPDAPVDSNDTSH
ncbi:hypothetical protein OZX68_00470 [Streptococcaceae bacterium ESL0729]|nr:hypothetical protein OZX68_00470 [Streptococcaceae bacterium ESL0729]